MVPQVRRQDELRRRRADAEVREARCVRRDDVVDPQQRHLVRRERRHRRDTGGIWPSSPRRRTAPAPATPCGRFRAPPAPSARHSCRPWGRPARRSCPSPPRHASARWAASAMSPTKTGWKRVVPATNSGVRKSPSSFIFGIPSKNTGKTGTRRTMDAKRLKKSSSGPNTRLGLKTVASGKASLTLASPGGLGARILRRRGRIGADRRDVQQVGRRRHPPPPARCGPAKPRGRRRSSAARARRGYRSG